MSFSLSSSSDAKFPLLHTKHRTRNRLPSSRIRSPMSRLVSTSHSHERRITRTIRSTRHDLFLGRIIPLYLLRYPHHRRPFNPIPRLPPPTHRKYLLRQ